MKRRIVKIDAEKCTGCGACAAACHESAIGMINGKAVLLREDYCDGLGDCLPACPAGAISFEEREAAAYDEQAVLENKRKASQPVQAGCPGARAAALPVFRMDAGAVSVSQLRQWPVQIKLAPITAPFYRGAKLLVAADCTAYAYGAFHEHFIKDHVTLIGCPKLDGVDYSDKLAEILRRNEIESVKIVRMEVPCCGGLSAAVKNAIQRSGKDIPLNVVVISTDGKILQQ